VVALAMKGREILKERKEAIEKAPLPQVNRVAVKVVKPKEGEVTKSVKLLATVKSDKSIKVSTKMAGFIKKIYVKESDRVKKGQLLVKIDERELINNINSLKATIEALKKDLEVSIDIYERNKKLYEVGGLPREKLEISLSGLKLKEAKLNEVKEKLKSLKSQLSYLNIRAPFSGIVESLLMYEGDLAVTGKPILIMSDNSKKLVFTFTESDNVKLGDRVLYKRREIAKVSNIYSSAKNSLYVAEARVKRVATSALLLNSDIKVEIVKGRARGCTLPTDSLIHKKDGIYIMEYKDNRFKPLKVKILVEGLAEVLVEPCPTGKVAVGSESKLNSLVSYGDVEIGALDE